MKEKASQTEVIFESSAPFSSLTLDSSQLAMLSVQGEDMPSTLSSRVKTRRAAIQVAKPEMVDELGHINHSSNEKESITVKHLLDVVRGDNDIAEVTEDQVVRVRKSKCRA